MGGSLKEVLLPSLDRVRHAVRIVDVAVGELELDGGVGDAIVVRQKLIHFVQQFACALHRHVPHHQMTGEGGTRRADGPDVQVVHTVNDVNGGDGAGYRVGIDPARR